MKYMYRLLIIASFTITAIVAMVLLYRLSDYTVHHDNSFIRNFPMGTGQIADVDLRYDSFYFAGLAGDKILLGNSTAPLVVAEFDLKLENPMRHHIKIKDAQTSRLSNALQLRVMESIFFLVDGTRGAILSGKRSDWTAAPVWNGNTAFTQAQITSGNSMIFRTIDKRTGESELGRMKIEANAEPNLNGSLLEKQIDGVFDSDGILSYDNVTQKAVYVYLYRNEVIVTDQDLALLHRTKTIDTISQANIQVAYLPEHHEKKLSAPPLVVNKAATVDKNSLFINSGLPGRFEDNAMWSQASIIDVYDFNRKIYRGSFYVYDINGKKLRSLAVKGNLLYALIDTHLVCYRIGKNILPQADK